MTPSTWSNQSNASPNDARIVGTERPGINRGIDVADEFKDDPKRTGSIEVILHHLGKRGPRARDPFSDLRVLYSIGRHGLEASQAVHKPGERFFSLRQAVPREPQLLAVMRRDERVAQRGCSVPPV